jgi:hypothetical protein
MPGRNTIEIVITGEDRASPAIEDVDSNLGRMGDAAGRAGGPVSRFGEILDNALGTAAGIVVANTIDTITSRLADFAGSLISLNADMEVFHAQFATLLGSEEEAARRLEYLEEFARRTPFDLPGVIEASRILEVFGGEALSTGESLTLLGDMAASAQVPAQELATWYGRLYSNLQSGRPIGEAAMRMQELGLMTGEARTTMEDMIEAGVAGADVWDFFTSEMGRFSGLMEVQSGTLRGIQANIEDTWDGILRTLGEPIFDVVKGGAEDFLAFMESEQVQRAVDQIAQGIRDALGMVVEIVGRVVQGVQDLIGWLEPAAPLLETIGKAIAIVVTGLVAFEVAGAALAAVGGLVSAAWSPVTALVLAIAAAIAIWENDLLGIRTALQPVVDAVGNFLSGLRNIPEFIENTVVPAIKRFIINVAAEFKMFFEATLPNLLEKIGTEIKRFFEVTLQTALNNFIAGVYDIIGDVETVWNDVQRLIGRGTRDFVSQYHTMADELRADNEQIADEFEARNQHIVDGWQLRIDAVNDWRDTHLEAAGLIIEAEMSMEEATARATDALLARFGVMTDFGEHVVQQEQYFADSINNMTGVLGNFRDALFAFAADPMAAVRGAIDNVSNAWDNAAVSVSGYSRETNFAIAETQRAAAAAQREQEEAAEQAQREQEKAAEQARRDFERAQREAQREAERQRREQERQAEERRRQNERWNQEWERAAEQQMRDAAKLTEERRRAHLERIQQEAELRAAQQATLRALLGGYTSEQRRALEEQQQLLQLLDPQNLLGEERERIAEELRQMDIREMLGENQHLQETANRIQEMILEQQRRQTSAVEEMAGIVEEAFLAPISTGVAQTGVALSRRQQLRLGGDPQFSGSSVQYNLTVHSNAPAEDSIETFAIMETLAPG